MTSSLIKDSISSINKNMALETPKALMRSLNGEAKTSQGGGGRPILNTDLNPNCVEP